MAVRYVRVRDESGATLSIPQKKYDLRPDRFELVDGSAVDQGGNPLPPVSPELMPARNASTDEWRAFGLERGLSSEQADDMSRDDLVAHFTKEN